MTLTVGIEEEYLVVDPISRAVVPEAEPVLRGAAVLLGELVGPAVTRYQVGARTRLCGTLADLTGQVHEMRSVVASAAAEESLRIAAVGSPVIGDVVPPLLTEVPRYRHGDRTYRALNDELSVCACRVHVHLPCLEQALRVSNYLRPWLPTLIALSANSPFWAGRETGYASWRTITLSRWPVAGPPPYYESVEHFEDLVGMLLKGGVLMDLGTILWDIRPAEDRLDVRVADMPSTAGESVLLAALIRALVTVALDANGQGPRISAEVLRAACWRSARDGLEGDAIDVHTGRLVPAKALVESLLVHVRSTLRAAGVLDLVADGWARLRERGSGAARQRAAYAGRGALTDVVDHLVTQTAGRVEVRRSS